MSWRLRVLGRLRLGAEALEVSLDTDCPAVLLSGPSGSGKTTLLRALAGLGRLERGSIEAGGAVWQDDAGAWTPPWRRGVGWAPQEALLFPHLSVRDNLRFGARSDADAEQVAGALELAPLLGRWPAGLSGGERQRVALGRALASRPRLLLLDEPFSALDEKRRARTISAVDELCARWSLPFVVVSHGSEDISTLARERWTIEAGLLSRS